MFIRRLFRSPTVGSIADWTSLIQIVWPFLAGGALLTWPASAIEPVMRYGWGAAFFLGLFSICVIVVIASIGLVAWRVFLPLKPDQRDSFNKQMIADSKTEVDETILERLHNVEGQVGITFDSMAELEKRTLTNCSLIKNDVSNLFDRFVQIDDLLKPDPLHLTLLGRLGDNSPPPKNKFESIDREINKISDQLSGSRDAFIKTIDDLKGQIKSTDDQISIGYKILATSLRARDAKEIVQKADAVVTELGDKLIKADDYQDDDWRMDYMDWYKSLDRIDRIVGQWTESHRPFLNIDHRDYERTGHAAPSHIVAKNDGNSIRYKNVWIAQQRYINQRDNMLTYFEQKASELPG